jgi:integrase
VSALEQTPTVAVSLRMVDADPLRDSKFPGARAAREHADWLNWLEVGDRAVKTIKEYSLTGDLLLKAFPLKAFEEFTDGDLLYVLKKVPPGSRHMRTSALRSWFRWGIKTRRITANPCDLLPDIRKPKQKVVVVYTEAQERALESLPAPDGQLATVLFEAGLRKAEACHVRSRNFNLDTRELHLLEATKGGKERVVVISERLAIAIEELRILEGLSPSDFLWYTRPGGTDKNRHDRPKTDSGMQGWWERCVKASGVPYRKLHTTRHTYATRWRERGLPLDDLQLMLGHESVQTTSDLYVHTEVRDVRKRMDALLPETEQT